jgi:glucuronoarabinoxylan endo-1,4-beta-xylanase
LQRRRSLRWPQGGITDSTPPFHFVTLELACAFIVVWCLLTLTGCGGTFVAQSTESVSAQTQAATVNWTNVHQIIDGFGASNEGASGNLSSADQAFFFGTGSGQLGLSILRVKVPDNGGSSPTGHGDCSSISLSCAGITLGDMQAIVANGGRVYASPWAPPAAYMTNGYTECSAGSGNGSLISGDYGAYATWLANFALSVQTVGGIPLYAISIQNEPDMCESYDSALWTAAQIDTFIKTSLGPTFASDGLSTLIFEPEVGVYANLSSYGGTCGADSSCTSYVGGYNWHDYDANLSGANTVTADPYPSAWATGKKYWETEAACLPGSPQAPDWCLPAPNASMADALQWAAVIDQRIAGDSANAWLYWELNGDGPDDQGLTISSGNPAKRAYMLGQYSKFARPGYYRIDATRQPQSGLSVSAYQNAATNALVIIATNYTGSAMSQTFDLTNAPAFSTLTPTITSATQSLAAQSNVFLSGNSFTYTLPADSITTFAGSAPIP